MRCSGISLDKLVENTFALDAFESLSLQSVWHYYYVLLCYIILKL
jgi:hypothetical protein